MIWEQDNMLWEQDNILMEQDNLFFVAWPYYFYYICDKKENKKKLLTNKHLNKNTCYKKQIILFHQYIILFPQHIILFPYHIIVFPQDNILFPDSYRSFYVNIAIMLIRGTIMLIRWTLGLLVSGYVYIFLKFVLITIRSFSRSWLTPCVVTRVTRRVLLLSRDYVPFGNTRVHLVFCMPMIAMLT
jgi:hypothetical protein